MARVFLLCILLTGCMNPVPRYRDPYDPGADDRIYRRTIKAWIHETYGETK